MLNYKYDWIEPLFDSFWSIDSNYSGEVYENSEGDKIFELEVPGFNSKNLSVEVLQDKLVIKGEREVEGKKSNSVISKKYNIGDLIVKDASLVDGILSIKLGMPEEKKPLKIELK